MYLFSGAFCLLYRKYFLGKFGGFPVLDEIFCNIFDRNLDDSAYRFGMDSVIPLGLPWGKKSLVELALGS